MPKFNRDKFANIGAGLLSEASKTTKTVNNDVMEIVYKDRCDLTPSNENKYSIEKIRELADTIKITGRLQQPIIYLEPPLPNGTYEIIAGHRRYEALGILASEVDPKFAENIPCTPVTLDIVDLPISEESKKRFLIISTNIDNRDKSDKDIMNEYLIQKEIYTEAKKNGYKLTDKMRNILAKDLNISPAQVGKIDYISKHAIDPVKAAIQDEYLTIADADRIAHMATEEQERVIEEIQDQVSQNSTKDSVQTKKEVKKAIRPKIVDTLEDDSYTIQNDDIREIYSKLQPIQKNINSTVILDKNNYAKYLSSLEKIKKEMDKLDKLLKSNN